MKPTRAAAVLVLLLSLAADTALAGGPWVPLPGRGYLFTGYSRKTANSIWDTGGTVRVMAEGSSFQNHDFRYVYLSGEVGLVKNVSATFLGTWLYGLEGPTGHLEKNTGFSDAWVGLKYQFLGGQVPMAASLTLRTPILYDMEGPYTRQLLNAQGDTVAHSPEWRGLLKHDVTASYHAGASIQNGKGWVQAELGYTWRQGAPADQIPFYVDAGIGLPLYNVKAKVTSLFVQSLGNFSERKPDDRFGNPAPTAAVQQNLNDASMWRAGISLFVPVGREQEWMFEAGYNHWLWGRSARQYKEPFFSVGKRL